VLERFGPRRTILFALGATAVRLFLYSVISNPVLALAVQVMHGATFSLFLVAAVNYAKELAPPGMGATAQAVLTSTNMGAGGIIGALLGGVLYDRMGIQPMFLTAAVLLAVAFVAFAVAARVTATR
jgi:predicted MFS family arabinose efflux permease